MFLILPRNYTKEKVIVNSGNDQIANRDLKLKFISIRKVKTEEEKVKHTHRFTVIQQR